MKRSLIDDDPDELANLRDVLLDKIAGVEQWGFVRGFLVGILLGFLVGIVTGRVL